MSEGPRIPIERADALAAYLFERWSLDRRTCHVVGSVRRRRDWVGDLELLAPLEPKGADRLCATIEGTVQATGLFAGSGPPPIGRVVSGLKPGFKACSLVVRLKDGVEIPVQVNRAGPENFGWAMIKCTGPREFGMWFLQKWKEHWQIPVGDEKHQASVDGFMVDSSRRVVPVPTEADAFRLAGLQLIDPHRRDAFMDQISQRGAAR